MAYLPIVQGVIREIYEDTVGQANVSVNVDTGIAISARQLSRVRGMLVVSSVAGGVPVITAAWALEACCELCVNSTSRSPLNVVPPVALAIVTRRWPL